MPQRPRRRSLDAIFGPAEPQGLDAIFGSPSAPTTAPAPEQPDMLERLGRFFAQLGGGRRPDDPTPRRPLPADFSTSAPADATRAYPDIEGLAPRHVEAPPEEEERPAVDVRALQDQMRREARGRLELGTASARRGESAERYAGMPMAEISRTGALAASLARGTGAIARGVGATLQLGDAVDEELGAETRIGQAMEGWGEKVSSDPAFRASSRAGMESFEGTDLLDPDWWLEAGGEQAPQLALSIGAALLTGGQSTVLQFAAFAAPTGLQMTGDAYRRTQEALAERDDLTEAQKEQMARGLGVLTGIGAAALERIPYATVLMRQVPGAEKVFATAVGQRIRNALANPAARVGAAAMGEGVEEVGQEAWSDVLQFASGADPAAFADWQARYGMAAALGAGVGGVAAVGLEGAQGAPEQRTAEEEAAQREALQARITADRRAMFGRPEGEQEERTPLRRRLAGLLDPSLPAELEEVRQLRDQERRERERDELTGLGNRAALNRAMAGVDESAEWEWVAIDADNLKALNDEQGHQAGDEFLQRIGAAIQSRSTRGFHPSGDEFMVAVPAGQGEAVARAIEAEVGRAPAAGVETGVSWGVGSTLTEADQQLLEKKRSRRAAGKSYRGAPAAPAAPMPQAPEVAAVNPDLTRDPNVGRARLEVLDVEPERFQYKLGTGEGGVTRALEGVTVWDDTKAGILQVWRDPADGRLKVVNGHHRVALAKRLGVEDVLVRLIEAESAEEAREIGALTNIVEGRGTPIDAAKLFRDGDYTLEDLRQNGVPMTEATAREGIALAQLAPALFERVVSGKLTIKRGAIIGAAKLTEAQQVALVQQLDKLERRGKEPTNSELTELIRLVADEADVSVSQETLFGTEQLTQALAFEKAQLSAWVKGRLLKDARILSAVSKADAAGTIEEYGAGEIDRVTATEAAQDVRRLEEVYNRLSTRGGPVSAALTEAARQLAHGGKRAEINKQLLANVRTAIEAELAGAGLQQRPEAARAAAGEGEPADAGRGAAEPAAAEPEEPAERPLDVAQPDDETGSLFEGRAGYDAARERAEALGVPFFDHSPNIIADLTSQYPEPEQLEGGALLFQQEMDGERFPVAIVGPEARAAPRAPLKAEVPARGAEPARTDLPRSGANWHRRWGWRWDEHAGSSGGMVLDLGDGLMRIVTRYEPRPLPDVGQMIRSDTGEEARDFPAPPRGHKYEAWLVRFEDGETLSYTTHRTRDEAMRSLLPPPNLRIVREERPARATAPEPQLTTTEAGVRMRAPLGTLRPADIRAMAAALAEQPGTLTIDLLHPESGAVLATATAERPTRRQIGQLANRAEQDARAAQRGQVRESRPAFGAEQEEPAPASVARFYSRTERAIERAPFRRGTGAQWLAALKKAKEGTPAREREHIGLDEWLKGNAAEVLTREQVLERFRQAQLRLEESLYTDDGDEDQLESDESRDAWAEADQRHFTANQQVSFFNQLMLDRRVPQRVWTRAHTEALEPIRKLAEEVRQSPDLLDADIRDQAQVAARSTLSGIPDMPTDEAAVSRFAAMLEASARRDVARELAERTPRERAGEDRFGRSSGMLNYDAPDYWTEGVRNRREVLVRLASQQPTSARQLPDLPAGWSWNTKGARPVLVAPDGRGYGEIDPLEAVRRAARAGRLPYWVLPIEDDPFEGPHWADKNVVVHIRMGDATDPEGRRVLVVDEIQSDWAQAARKKVRDSATGGRRPRGMRDRRAVEQLRRRQTELDEEVQRVTAEMRAPAAARQRPGSELGARLDALRAERDRLTDEWNEIHDAVPALPWRKTEEWAGLALRRIIDEAVRGGYDRIAFTTGAQQNARYNLARLVDRIHWQPDQMGPGAPRDGRRANGTLTVVRNGEVVFRSQFVPEDELEEYVGPTTAAELRAAPEGQLRLPPRIMGVYDHANGGGIVYQLWHPTISRQLDLNDMVEPPIATVDPPVFDTDEDARAAAAGMEIAIATGHDLQLPEGRTVGEDLAPFYDTILPKLIQTEARRLDPAAEVREDEGVRSGGVWIVRDPDGVEVAHWPDDAGQDAEEDARRFASEQGAGYTFALENPTTPMRVLEVTPQLRTAAGEQGFRLMEDRPDYAAAQDDLFGGPAELVEGSEQRDMFGGNGQPQRTLAQQEADARAVVARLGPIVKAGRASARQLEQYREARALLNRHRAMDDEEVQLRARQEQREPLPELPDQASLFEGRAQYAAPDPATLAPDAIERADIEEEVLAFGSRAEARRRAADIDQLQLGLNVPESTPRRPPAQQPQPLTRQPRAPRPPTDLDPARRRALVRRFGRRRQRRVVDIRDRVIRTMNDAAKLLQPFRNPRMEVMHYIYMSDDGRVLAHERTTSGVISASAAFELDPSFVNPQEAMKAGLEARLDDMAKRAKRLGATRIMLAHNHPSGNSEPSGADATITAVFGEGLQRRGIQLDGHIVIDTNEFAILTPHDFKGNFGQKGGLYWASVALPVGGEHFGGVEQVMGPSSVAQLVKQHASGRPIEVLYLDIQNKGVALEGYSHRAIPRLSVTIEQKQRAFAASAAAIVVYDADTYRRVLGSLNAPITLPGDSPIPGFPGVIDVVHVDPATGNIVSSAESQGRLGHSARRETSNRPFDLAELRLSKRRRLGRRLREERPPYHVEPSAPPAEPVRAAPFEAASEDIEARWQAAKGASRPGLRERILERLREVASSFRRHFRYIDPTASVLHARMQDELRLFEAIPAWAKAVAMDRISEVAAGLDTNQLDLLTRLLALEDIQKDVERGLYEGREELPFGYTEQTLEEDLEAVRARVQQDPKVRTAAQKRRAFARDLTSKLVKAKLLPRAVLEDERYYHRQVMRFLEDAGVRAGSGGEVRAKKKGFQKERVGGGDFNVRYEQAEFEWVAQALSLLATKETLGRIKTEADIVPALKRQARQQNLLELGRILLARAAQTSVDFDADDPVAALELAHDALHPYRQEIAIANEQLASLAHRGELTSMGGLYDELIEELRDAKEDNDAINADRDRDDKQPLHFEHDDWFRFLDHLLEHDLPGAGAAGSIYRAISDRNAFIKETLGRRFKTWEQLVPEGHRIWQPEKGNRLYPASTIEEKVLAKILAQGGAMVTEADIRAAAVMGGAKEQWVIPEWLADTMDELQPNRSEAELERLWTGLQSSWKQWVLLNPLRALRYNLNNLSGDLDIAFAYDPAILTKYAGPAARDLRRQLRGKLDTKLKAELEAWTREGVLQSGLTVEEIPDISEEGIFRALSSEQPNLAQKAWTGYWELVRGNTTWRENILRLAAARYFLDQLKAGRKVYGASNREEIDAFRKIDRHRLAAKLGRELIGDYGNISAAGQWIRRHMIPFYSWIEINAPRYYRLLKNLPADEVQGSSRGARVVASATGRTAAKLGVVALKMNVLYLLVRLWNEGVMGGEDEEKLGDLRRQHHIILGKREDGTILSLRFEGAFSDALKWFGLHDYPADIRDLVEGRADWLDKVAEGAKAPIERVVQGWEPFSKTLFETIAGRSSFPTPFEEGASFRLRGRPIRDRGEGVARLFSLDWLVRTVQGRPRRPGGLGQRALTSLLVYQTDPGEAAYYQARDIVNRWLKEQGGEAPDIGFTERGNALYYYKQAVKWGDDAAAERWLARYFELGGTNRGMHQSIERSDPLGPIARRRRRRFLMQLEEREREVIEEARTWYDATMRRPARARRRGAAARNR